MLELIAPPYSFPSTVLLIVVAITIISCILSKRNNSLPGPLQLIPLLGYAPNIAYALYKGKPLYKYFVELGHRYGKVYSFTALGIPFIILNDQEAIREAYQDPKLNDRGDNELQAKVFSRTYNKWIDMAPCRIFILSCFQKFGIGTSRFEEQITVESTNLIEELEKLNGKPVDLTWYINNAVSNIISKCVFGTRFEYTDERIHRLTDLLNRYNELIGSGGLEIFVPINIPSKRKEQINKVVDEVLEFINKMIASHRLNFDPDDLNDIIDMWLNEIQLKRSHHPDSYLNPVNMPGQIFLLFLAGTDTTTNTLRWSIQYLVRYPEIQDRIHRELDSVIGRNRLPKLTDKLNLPYTQAVIMELHRIISLIPLSVFHVAGETTYFRGHKIHKNSVVVANLYAVMQSRDVWGDPEVFRPERFLDSEGNIYDERKEVIPFGIGRRVCLGEALAKHQLFLFFTHLLHQFRFEKPSENASPPTLEPIDGIVVHPQIYELCVIKRD